MLSSRKNHNSSLLHSFFCGKQKAIREKKDEQESKSSAAIEIQRVWRGYEARLVSLFHEYLLIIICS